LLKTMHKKILFRNFLGALALSVAFWGCKTDDYDGLLNLDPAPAAAITFPQSVAAHGHPIQEDNAYIIRQSSLQSGNVTLDIKVAEGKQIQSVSIAAQRYRSPMTAPNFSPPVPADQNLRSPRAALSRTSAANIATNLAIGPANMVTFSMAVNNLPAVLTTSGSGTATTNLGALRVGDTIRFFVRATLTDNTVQRAIEARVVVVE
jgi:hypothetical protein